MDEDRKTYRNYCTATLFGLQKKVYRDLLYGLGFYFAPALKFLILCLSDSDCFALFKVKNK